ncbi:MAG TPA: hypothetical protein DCL60_05690 [Armatimonadetes bacterium]|nr:hypothetical protein [Armatimonadota bacterium]
MDAVYNIFIPQDVYCTEQRNSKRIAGYISMLIFPVCRRVQLSMPVKEGGVGGVQLAYLGNNQQYIPQKCCGGVSLAG